MPKKKPEKNAEKTKPIIKNVVEIALARLQARLQAQINSEVEAIESVFKALTKEYGNLTLSFKFYVPASGQDRAYYKQISVKLESILPDVAGCIRCHITHNMETKKASHLESVLLGMLDQSET